MQARVFAHVVLWILLAGCAAASDGPGNPEPSTTQVDAAESSTAALDATQTTAESDPEPSDSSDASTTTSVPNDDATTDASESEDTSSIDPDVGAPVVEVPPLDDASLLPWLQRGEYLDWQAESAIHPSAGPHGGDVRTFVNSALFDSLAAGADVHPIDAATVKELYYDGDSVVGWAVMVKVAPGEGGDTWYWYERVGASIYADGVGESLCFDCHEIGADQVRTPFPLQ